MYCLKKIKDDTYWVGANDRRLALFENVFPIPNGVAYNSYLITDEKNVLFDTVDSSVATVFFENISKILGNKELDYVIVNHMEPDHCATLGELISKYPKVQVVGNSKTIAMIKQFFDFDIDNRSLVVKEGDTLSTGNHNLTFLMAPMVHWPEAMVTYDITAKALYSADAFGTFGALNGNIFADEIDFQNEFLNDARRYYTNIVGKYGTQVQALLKKASTVDIEMICPLHGPIWRSNINWFMDKYQKWSSYTPEINSVMIIYASVYGNTKNAAEILANMLSDRGVRNIAMYDVSVTHPSYIVADAFKYSHIVVASTTYNAGIFCNMQTALEDLQAHNLQNRTVAIVENGSWAPTAGNLIRKIFSSMKNINIISSSVTIKSALKNNQIDELSAIADELVNSLKKDELDVSHTEKIENNAFFNLSYGLFVLSAKDNDKDNGCIINTVMQITDTPKRISIAVNKSNFTNSMILKTKEFNISVLSCDAPFKLFEHFGFSSGRQTDKFKDFSHYDRSENGISYLNKYSNSYISAKVIDTYDYDTHTVFIADVTEAKVLSSSPSVTYDYYFKNIKPQPQSATGDKKGYVCKICGYVYEGDTLPSDFICPLCKHGAEDFEKQK